MSTVSRVLKGGNFDTVKRCIHLRFDVPNLQNSILPSATPESRSLHFRRMRITRSWPV